MNTSKSSVAVCVALFAASMLSACGDRQDAQGPGQAGLVPAGDSGLIPARHGFAEVDLAGVRAAKSVGLCAVDVINGQGLKAARHAIALANADRIKVAGWVLTPDKRSPASLAVVLQGDAKAYALRADGGRKRADVARAVKSDEAVRAGYSVESELKGVAPGEYAVSVLQDTGGTPTICATRYKVAVTGE